MSGGLPTASTPVACHHRSLHDVAQSPSAGVFLADGGSAVSSHGCHAPVVGWPSGLCLPSLRPHLMSSGEGTTISGVGVDSSGSVLDSTPRVSGPSGASGEDSFLLPRRRDLLKQQHFHRFHQNLPMRQLTAYRISSDPLVIPDSLQRWLVNLPTAVVAP